MLPPLRILPAARAAAALALPLLLAAPVPAQACGIPLPNPGQTVTWTLAGSPYQVCQDLTIVAGGTVLVEPGVVLSFDPSRKLRVDGALIAPATAAAPFTIGGAASGRLSVSGLLELDFAVVSVQLRQAAGSTIFTRDCSFTASAWFDIDIPIDAPMVFVMERCDVATQYMWITGQSLLRDVTFSGQMVDLRGYSRLDGLDAGSAPVTLYRDFQPGYVGPVKVSGAPGAGLVLRTGSNAGGADFLLGPDVDVTACGFPVELAGAGLAAGSQVPLGNQADVVLGYTDQANWEGHLTFPDVGVPYRITGHPTFSGLLDVRPGVTFEMGPKGYLAVQTEYFNHTKALRGLPGLPIRFVAQDPASGWLALVGQAGTHLFEHLVVQDATVGISSPQSQVFLNECEIRRCQEGLGPSGLGTIHARGVQFLDNVAGAVTDMSALSSTGLDLDGSQRPNVFAGNTLAVKNITPNSLSVPAESNWWNHATGPFNATTNPGGQGDPVDFKVDFVPWRTQAPDLSDVPPVVRLSRPFFLAEPGATLLLRWEASDDVGVVSQRLLLDTKGGGAPAFQTVADLDGQARSYEFVVPSPGFNVAARPALLRLEAVDTAGNRSFDELSLHIPEQLPQGTFSFTSDLSGPFEIGEHVLLCWSAFGVTNGALRTYVVLDNDERIARGPNGNSGNSCTFSDWIVPMVSTDRARIAVVSDANGNRDEWYFSEPFAIRPTALLEDAPPTVQLLSPTGGETFTGGGVVPVAWTASDDEGLNGFKLLASVDGGRIWQVIARDLPPGATDYAWQLPPSAGLADVRLRIVAFDRAFQNSSDGDDAVFSIAPGGDLGTRYCSPAVPNSTGLPAVIAATGSALVADDAFFLVASQLPPNQFGYFLASETQGLVHNPGGSQGDLCLAGNLARFAKQAQGSGAGGSFGIQVDLGQVPTNPPAAVQPGETWNFQAWYRDKNPGVTSNFTDAVSVLFQ